MAVNFMPIQQFKTERCFRPDSSLPNSDGQSLAERLVTHILQQVFGAAQPTDGQAVQPKPNSLFTGGPNLDGLPSVNEAPKAVTQSFEDMLRMLFDALQGKPPTMSKKAEQLAESFPAETRPGLPGENGFKPNAFQTYEGTPKSFTTAPTTTAPLSSQPPASTLSDAATRTQVTFKPVLRGDEAEKDAKIHTQADFGRATDEVAREYGLDPNLFRAQLQSESSAFTRDFREALKAEGDLDRAGDNNTSIGLGQISRKFLDGREWSDGGPGNERMGKQVVTTEQYKESATVQLRMAASNLAQRVADNGGLQNGLSYYVSGNPDPSNAKAAHYLENIERSMKDPNVVNVGR